MLLKAKGQRGHELGLVVHPAAVRTSTRFRLAQSTGVIGRFREKRQGTPIGKREPQRAN